MTTLLNKVWNHYDVWKNESVLGSHHTWELLLRGLEKENPLGYSSPNAEFVHVLAGGYEKDGQDEVVPFTMNSLNHQIACMVEYRRWGQQTVVVGPEMQAAFSDTELGKVPSSHLKFPFPAYWLALPDNEDLLVWGGEPGVACGEEGMPIFGTGWHKVKGAYIIDMSECTGKNCFLVYMWGPDPIDPTIREKNKEKGAVQVVKTDDQAHLWFSVNLDHSDDDIETQIINVFADPLNEIFDKQPLDHSTNLYNLKALHNEEAVHNTVTETATKITRIIVNSALYMTSPRADLMQIGSNRREELLSQAQDLHDQASKTSGKAARNWRRQAENKERKANRYKPPVTWIGPKIEEAISANKGGRGASDSKQKGHVRKGHWHMYRIGRMIDDAGEKIAPHLRNYLYHWIAPTWCGDLDTKHEKHTHAFKEV